MWVMKTWGRFNRVGETVTMQASSVYFTAGPGLGLPGSDAGPAPGQALVQTQLSAISPGTELLIYRGQVRWRPGHR